MKLACDTKSLTPFTEIMVFSRLVSARGFATSALRRGGDAAPPAPGDNLPFSLNNRCIVIIYFFYLPKRFFFYTLIKVKLDPDLDFLRGCSESGGKFPAAQT